MTKQVDFAKQLLKGRIAEFIFDQMFRDSKKFTVIPFGYEAVMPELQQYTRGTKYEELLDTIRNAPDFALVSHDPTCVYLVEVKFRASLKYENTKERAETILNRWKFAHVFYATPSGFYFDRCTDLTVNGAKVTPLPVEMVSANLQQKYLSLLKEFIVR